LEFGKVLGDGRMMIISREKGVGAGWSGLSEGKGEGGEERMRRNVGKEGGKWRARARGKGVQNVRGKESKE